MLSPHEMLVSAPERTTVAELEKLILTKADWIAKQAARLEALADTALNSAVTEGSQVLFLGQSYTIQVRLSAVCDVSCYNNTIVLSYPQNGALNVETLLKDWYVKAAAKMFQEKTLFWAPRLGVTPQRITIKDQKTRWGSCSSNGSIAYNWRVIMAPPAVIDYLVVHELCHMAVANHSAKFWEMVELALPAYKAHRQWLKEHGRLLARIL